jgi:hypothetical protein
MFHRDTCRSNRPVAIYVICLIGGSLLQSPAKLQ